MHAPNQIGNFGLYSFYYFGALYVVIEGFRDLKLNDDAVENFLKKTSGAVQAHLESLQHIASVSIPSSLSKRCSARATSHHEGKKGEQHAKDLGLMDALQGRSKSAFAERINCKKGGLLNELTANDSWRRPC
jgi:hypothetical protein